MIPYCLLSPPFHYFIVAIMHHRTDSNELHSVPSLTQHEISSFLKISVTDKTVKAYRRQRKRNGLRRSILARLDQREQIARSLHVLTPDI